MLVTAGERIAASVVVLLVAAMTAAYAIDRVGFTISPLLVLAIAVAAAAFSFVSLRTDASLRGETVAFIAVVGATLGYLLWLARPSLLPLGSGPDLTHHLMLVDYIEHLWRLPHDPGLGAVMGEMVHYTPGLHLFTALAGAWTRSDGLHAIYPVVALSVALKAGFVFLIAMRVLPRDAPRAAFAIAAIVMLFAPREYFLRSFTEHSFLAQVLSELFAVAMWWALVAWDERPSRAAMIVFAVAGIGAFLTWPVWIGPLTLLLAAMVATRGDLSPRERALSLAVAGAPIAAIAAVHAAGRLRATAIAGSGGFVVWPSAAIFTWWFLALSCAGLIVASVDRRARSIVWLVAAIALQAAALVVVANRSGADRPYLALKMVYLSVYPLAIAGAVTLAVGSGWRGRMGGTGGGMAGEARPSSPPSRPSRLSSLSCLSIVVVLVLRGLTREPRPQHVVSTPMYLAGQWARANLPAACIDYLVQDDDSAYWLHLAVLGNARQTERTRDPGTFDPKQALIRWIQPAGLPFAITDDFEALPKDIRTDVDIVRRFEPAAIVKRRGPSTCH